MKVVTYKAIKEIDERLISTYIAYKGYFPNSIITKRSAKHVFESKRTKEPSYQVVNRQIKLLIKNGLLENHLNGWKLKSKKELSLITDNKPNSLYAKVKTGSVKETILYLTLVKLDTRLKQIEYRKLTKSKRPNKSLNKYTKSVLKSKQGAFTQVSYTSLSKAFKTSRDTTRRRIHKLYMKSLVSIIGASRTAIRRLAKLEKPWLNSGEFIYKGFVYAVESPKFRVNHQNASSTTQNLVRI